MEFMVDTILLKAVLKIAKKLMTAEIDKVKLLISTSEIQLIYKV